MASLYDSVDLDFTWDGDYIIDSSGDLKDTSDDYLKSIQNEIFSIVKSSVGDWKEDPQLGADLDDFIGEPNDRNTAANMKARLQSSLTQVVNAKDLSVRIVPVHLHKVLIIINLEVIPTAQNKMRGGNSVTINFLYDYFEKGVYVDIDDMNHFVGRNI
jgi:hypothetical protein